MNNLEVRGTQNFKGIEIPVIEGGFGEGKRCMGDKTIAEIHDMQTIHVRENISKNIKRFKEGIDFIDLKVIGDIDNNLELLTQLGYTKMQISKAEHIYLLSERGYAKLIKIMDSDLAWEIHDELMDEYFAMREVINSDEQLKANLLLQIYNGGQEGILASKQLTELEVKEATKPLLDKIEEDKPLVAFADRVLKDGDNILVRELAKVASDQGYKIGEKKLYKKLREWGYIFKDGTEPKQKYIDNGYFVVESRIVQTPYGSRQVFTTKISPRGQIHIVERLIAENVA